MLGPSFSPLLPRLVLAHTAQTQTFSFSSELDKARREEIGWEDAELGGLAELSWRADGRTDGRRSLLLLLSISCVHIFKKTASSTWLINKKDAELFGLNICPFDDGGGSRAEAEEKRREKEGERNFA